MANSSTIHSDLRDARDDDMLLDRGAEFIASSLETNPISLLIYEYELAQGATPNDPAIHFNFGVAALEQGLESYAIEALTKYVRAVPEDADGFYQLGLAYAAKGSFRDAARRYEQAQKLNPDDADILIALHFA